MGTAQRTRLRKEIGLFSATLYGVGIIVGAGIYVLLGIGAGIAGNAVWISFVIAALLAFCTGFSYAELSSMYPKDAAEYVYTKKAFGRKWFSFMVEWLMVTVGVISAATVALGFANYWVYLFGGSVPFVAAALIAVLSAVNYFGIRTSTKVASFSAIVEASGLVVVALAGMLIFFGGKAAGVDFFYSPSGMGGILSATAIIFFAYLGFEELVNISEETKDARKTMPRALVLSLIISTVLYIAVSITAVSVLGYEKLAQSQAPIAEVMEHVFPGSSGIMGVVALISTTSTVLVILVVVSRMLYGLACNHSLPDVCKSIGRFNTPYVSVLLVMLATVTAVYMAGIRTVASLTDVGIFVVYMIINSALIFLRYKKPDAPRLFRSPVNLGKFPVLALFGIVASLALLTRLELSLITLLGGILAAGLVLYLFFNPDALKETKRR